MKPTLTEPPMTIAAVERQLRDLALLQKSLFAEVSRLKSQANRDKSAIISMFPTEITQLIFFFCLPDLTREDLDEDNRVQMKRTAAPLVLGHICRIWREIAWGTPELWHKLTLYMFPRNQALQAWMVANWLDRTAQFPLDITIYSYASKAVKHRMALRDDHAISFFHVLKRESCRWRSLRLRVPADSLFYLNKVLNAAGRRSEPLSPVLEELSIETFSVGLRHFIPLQIWHLAPHLKMVQLGSHAELNEIITNWRNLTSFSVGRLTVKELHEVLSKSIYLVNCRVSRLMPSPDQDNDILVHHHLRRLELLKDASPEGRAFASFLANVSLTRLEELDVTLSHFIDVYVSFIQRSRCPLRRMKVYFAHHVPQSGVVELLRATPSLEVLHICIRPDNAWVMKTIGSKFLRLLSRPGSSYQDVTTRYDEDIEPAGGEEVPLLPRLRDLELDGPVNFDWTVLCNFLESRYYTEPTVNGDVGRTPFCTLRSFRVTIHDTKPIPDTYLDEDVIACLRGLTADGFAVSIEYPDEGDKSMKSPTMVDLIEVSATRCETLRYLESLITD
ncbi:hypothetical protein GALMADRAFT_274739 [Galerina marginata CBS 339.88]|uniref:F-box domain-containing protein n=1 Tax=Galerina marginata (strain CBS 339.88) TaxID=685588 RepID=A0A067TUL3_GALM3|nr:hypothetical protein GALMADRAFT_274739 [Galerina marginata CBS 339.88]